jgi:ACR3 family arsenite efflux pump ArsB
LALVWLLTEGENDALYSAVAVTFLVQLLATAVIAAAITRSLLKGLKWR